MAESTFGLGFQAKNLFFDRQAVIAAAGRIAATNLARQAAYIRTVARRSMKPGRTKTGKVSKAAKTRQAGRALLTWAGDLKRLLWFAYDPGTRSAVVGPVKFKTGNVPALLEFGGTAARKRPGGGVESVIYRPFPYMGPALEKSLATFPQHWRASIQAA